MDLKPLVRLDDFDAERLLASWLKFGGSVRTNILSCAVSKRPPLKKWKCPTLVAGEYGAAGDFILGFTDFEPTLGHNLKFTKFMSQTKSSSDWGQGWIDSMAIGLSVLCAVLSVDAGFVGSISGDCSTFWVERDFHLWMLFFVLPTTCIAIFFVVSIAIVGLFS